MRKRIKMSAAYALSLTLLLGCVNAYAEDDDETDRDDDRDFPEVVVQGDPWQAPPYDFIFGNHIDTHVQLELKTKREQPKSLKGWFYVYFTGAVDEASGLPVARHPRGESHSERCGIDPIVCIAGWKMSGLPGAAKYLYHSGVNGNDHPVWMVNRAEEHSAPAAGMVIPQPGAYSHFHWITSSSQDPRAIDVSVACEKSTAGQLQDVMPTAANEICAGWFLQIKATQDFAFMHGGEVIPVYKGTDLRSHLNIVTNYDATTVAPITPTRTSGGH
jgi:hypothetical protein